MKFFCHFKSKIQIKILLSWEKLVAVKAVYLDLYFLIAILEQAIREKVVLKVLIIRMVDLDFIKNKVIS